eukprot:377108-Amphidinium_carterae.1
MANRLHTKTFAAVGDAELHTILTMFKEEGVEVSKAIETQLFERQLDKHLQHSEYKVAIDISWTFHETKFDVLNPKMSGRSLDMSEKIVEFQQLIFHKILVPLILDAANRKSLLAELVEYAMQELEKIDIVLLELSILAVAHDETLSLLRAIHTLLVCGSSVEKLFEVMTLKCRCQKEQTHVLSSRPLAGNRTCEEGFQLQEETVQQSITHHNFKQLLFVTCKHLGCLLGTSEADVQRMHKAGLKANSTCPSVIAVAVKKGPLVGVLEEFLTKSASILQKGPLLQKHMAAMESLPIQVASVKVVMEVANDLLGLKQCLMSNAADALETLFGNKVLELKEHSVAWSIDELSLLMQLFSVASTVVVENSITLGMYDLGQRAFCQRLQESEGKRIKDMLIGLAKEVALWQTIASST